jgi:hypothetical protein
MSIFTLRTAVLTKFSRRRYFQFILFLEYFIPSSVADDQNLSSPRHKSSTDVQKEVQTTCVVFFFLASKSNGLLRTHFETYVRSMAHKLVFIDNNLGNPFTSLKTTVLFMCVHTCICLYIYIYIYSAFGNSLCTLLHQPFICGEQQNLQNIVIAHTG